MRKLRIEEHGSKMITEIQEDYQGGLTIETYTEKGTFKDSASKVYLNTKTVQNLTAFLLVKDL